MTTTTNNTTQLRLSRLFWESHRWSGLERHIPAMSQQEIDKRVIRSTETNVWVELTDDEIAYLKWDASRMVNIGYSDGHYNKNSHDYDPATARECRSARSVVKAIIAAGH